LKWKSPSENSIDFKLELRFPPLADDDFQPDMTAKPTFLLHTWLGRERYEYFDEMEMEDDEWERYGRPGWIAMLTEVRLKETGDQLDDRIIEVSWDADRGTWQMLRIRDDKPHANHKSIMQKILISIEDGVEIEAVSQHRPSGRR
jgi:mRNA guanylyltransferase